MRALRALALVLSAACASPSLSAATGSWHVGNGRLLDAKVDTVIAESSTNAAGFLAWPWSSHGGPEASRPRR